MRLLHRVPLLLLAWTHVGWGLFLRLARPLGRVADDREARPAGPLAGASADAVATADRTAAPGPTVSLIIAAYAEQDVIADTIARLRAQTWPRERLQLIVACDGSPDATAERARAAGADVVLELERGGKHHAQTAGVVAATGELLLFSDANTRWEPDAVAELAAAFADPAVGYACGRVTFVAAEGGGNQEGAYWRLEMALRRRESDWWSVTAGNGAIYGLRADLWPRLRTAHGHDLSLPHQVVRLGRLAIDRPTAHASEPMVPSIEGEWRRKRRMMNQAWRIVLRGGRRGGLDGGILDPRGLPPRYLAAIVSHRWLRYASPFLHLLALAAGLRLLASGRAPRADRLLLAAHLALLAGAAGAGRLRWRPLLLCRYYVAMTASIAVGLADHLRHGAPVGWDPAEGTR